MTTFPGAQQPAVEKALADVQAAAEKLADVEAEWLKACDDFDTANDRKNKVGWDRHSANKDLELASDALVLSILNSQGESHER